MTHLLGPKAIACLRYVEDHQRARHLDPDRSFEQWEVMWAKLCADLGEKVAVTKLEELAERRYIEYGVSARMGWLTDKGRAALEAATITKGT